jgi:hypothetical protein
MRSDANDTDGCSLLGISSSTYPGAISRCINACVRAAQPDWLSATAVMVCCVSPSDTCAPGCVISKLWRNGACDVH